MNDVDVAIAVADQGAAVVRCCFGSTLQRLDKFDPPFPNAPGFRATTRAAEAGFVSQFGPRVLSTSLALACGFSVIERIEVPASKTVTVPVARMTKRIA